MDVVWDLLPHYFISPLISLWENSRITVARFSLSVYFIASSPVLHLYTLSLDRLVASLLAVWSFE